MEKKGLTTVYGALVKNALYSNKVQTFEGELMYNDSLLNNVKITISPPVSGRKYPSSVVVIDGTEYVFGSATSAGKFSDIKMLNSMCNSAWWACNPQSGGGGGGRKKAEEGPIPPSEWGNLADIIYRRDMDGDIDQILAKVREYILSDREQYQKDIKDYQIALNVQEMAAAEKAEAEDTATAKRYMKAARGDRAKALKSLIKIEEWNDTRANAALDRALAK